LASWFTHTKQCNAGQHLLKIEEVHKEKNFSIILSWIWVVQLVWQLGYDLDDQRIGFRFEAEARDLSPF
jgi:hypothetical protein